MTLGEILVIAAAAAVFILINLIMWSIIAAKNRKQSGRKASPQPEMAAVPVRTISPELSNTDFRILENIVIVHTDERI